MGRLEETPSQTVGPYFGMALGRDGDNVLAGPGAAGHRIRIEGRVLDGTGAPVEDALVEVWQANAAGRYRHPLDAREDLPLDAQLTGFGRCETDFDTGRYWFETVKPGPVPHPDGGLQAPHVNLIVQARGVLNPLFTRIYFPDEAEANAADPVLAAVPEDRRATLIAARSGDADPPTYGFDVRLRGERETVFFDF